MFADGIVLPTQGGTLTFASSGEKMAHAKPANAHTMCQVVIVLLAICGLLTAFKQVFDWRCPERLDIGFPKNSGVCLLLNLNEFCNLREFKVPCCRFRAGSSTLSLLYRVLCLVIHNIRRNSCHI